MIEQQGVVWRERTQLSHTLKDGWRVSEVTVEVTYPDGSRPTDTQRMFRLHDAIKDGEAVAAQKNAAKET